MSTLNVGNQEQRPSLQSTNSPVGSELGTANTSAAALKWEEQVSDEELLSDRSNSLNGMELDENENKSHHQQLRQSQQRLSLTDETDDGTIDNDRVEYAVLLPDSFAVLDSTFDQHSL